MQITPKNDMSGMIGSNSHMAMKEIKLKLQQELSNNLSNHNS